jgi:hypothetical protein
MKSKSQAGKIGSKKAAVSQDQTASEPIRTSTDKEAGNASAVEIKLTDGDTLISSEDEFQGMCKMLQSLPTKDYNVVRAVVGIMAFVCPSLPKPRIPKASKIREFITIVSNALPSLALDHECQSRVMAALCTAKAYLDKPVSFPPVGLKSADRLDTATADMLADADARERLEVAGLYERWAAQARRSAAWMGVQSEYSLN